MPFYHFGLNAWQYTPFLIYRMHIASIADIIVHNTYIQTFDTAGAVAEQSTALLHVAVSIAAEKK